MYFDQLLSIYDIVHLHSMGYELAHNTTCFYQPSIAQLVERWTVEVKLIDIHRSLVQIRLDGKFLFTNLFISHYIAAIVSLSV